MRDHSELNRWATEKANGNYDYGLGLQILALFADFEVSIKVSMALNETLKSVCESREALARVVEQLKAENSGLRTGYEAYQQVNAELKAQNERLRKDLQNLRTDKNQLLYALKQEEQSYLVLRAERDRLKTENEALRKNSDRYMFIRNEVSSRVADFCIVKKYWAGTFPDRILVLDGADVEIDAAMGQGEHSEIHHTSWALVHEPPPPCAKCGVKMFTGLTPQTLCNRCKDD